MADGHPIQAVIFDLDGVIVHTDIFHYRAWKHMADGLGLPFDETVNNRLRGVSRMESLDIILENAGVTRTDEEKQTLAHEKNRLYRSYLMEMTHGDVDPAVTKTLKLLRERGFKLAIGSSSKNAGTILERVGLDGFFDALSDGNNISNSKPDPEVFLKAAEFLKTEPNRCVIVEDAAAGIEAGRRAGMKTIAVGDAKRCGFADYTADSFEDIPVILETCASGVRLQTRGQGVR